VSFYIDTNLKFLLADLYVSKEVSISGIVNGAEKNDMGEVKKEYLNYMKKDRLYELGLVMLLDGKLTDWDWKWASDNGHLCNKDFEWYKEDLEKHNIKRT